MLFCYYHLLKRSGPSYELTNTLLPSDALCLVWLKKIFKFHPMHVYLLFCYTVISSWKIMWLFIWTNLNVLQLRMPCAKFGHNKPSGSWENENVKSIHMDGWTTDNQKSKLAQVSSIIQRIIRHVWVTGAKMRKGYIKPRNHKLVPKTN